MTTVTVAELRALHDSLRYAIGKCEVVLAGVLPYNGAIDKLPAFLAHFFEQGGNDRPLREWLRHLEELIVRQLIENGATGDALDRIMGLNRAARQGYFYRRYGIALTHLQQAQQKPKQKK